MYLISVLTKPIPLSAPRIFLLSFAILCAFLAQNTHAAPPVNDMFANAPVISGTSGTINGTNVDATAEVGEPDHDGLGIVPASHSVWFKWTAPSDNAFIFETNGSSFDTVLAAYTGSAVNSLTQVAADNNSGVGHHSQISFHASAGQVYSIAVDSGSADQGQITLQWGAANSINGTVTLPGGQTAPSGGIPVNVLLIDANWDTAGAAFVFIPAGSSSAAYTITGVLDPQRSLTLYYIYTGSTYLSRGYYSSRGTQWSGDAAEYFAGGTTVNGANLTLLDGNTIYGTLNLPDGLFAPPGGTLCSVRVLDENYQWQQSVQTTMAAGASSVLYSIKIPSSAVARRVIQGQCFQTDVYKTSYYNSSGSHWEQNGAEILTGGRDYAGINMIFFQTITISGTVSLPAPDVAGPGSFGTSVFAYAEGATWPIQEVGGIPSGGSTWGYSVIVPSGPAAKWRISYYGAETGYLYQGFHSSSGTHWNPANARLLPGGTDHANIDLTVIRSSDVGTISVSGRVTLPHGQTAPAHTEALIHLINPEYPDNYFETVTGILQGDSWADYPPLVAPLSPSNKWIARYYAVTPIYEQTGYYRGNRTVCSRNNTFRLNGATNHSNIDLILLRKCEWLLCFPAAAQSNGKTMICF